MSLTKFELPSIIDAWNEKIDTRVFEMYKVKYTHTSYMYITSHVIVIETNNFDVYLLTIAQQGFSS